MDFYEELGVSPRATEAEIRRSYKRLTQLLHPDRLTQEPELQALADLQMKRLNEMIDILSDPERRRAYDRARLETPGIVRQNVPNTNTWLINNRGWVLLGTLGLLFAVSAWIVPRFDEARSVAAKSAVETPPVPKPTVERSQLAPERIVRVSKKTVEAKLDLQESPAPVPELGNTPTGITPVDPLRGLIAPPAVAPPASTLAGRWVYSPDPRDNNDPKLYPPIFVELAISEANGSLHGAYRSRYRVPDRALSPFVNFVFEGTAVDTSFPWRGDAGARGEITVNLETSDRLKVNWFASTMGSALSLGAGSATLYRFR